MIEIGCVKSSVISNVNDSNRLCQSSVVSNVNDRNRQCQRSVISDVNDRNRLCQSSVISNVIERNRLCQSSVVSNVNDRNRLSQSSVFSNANERNRSVKVYLLVQVLVWLDLLAVSVYVVHVGVVRSVLVWHVVSVLLLVVHPLTSHLYHLDLLVGTHLDPVINVYIAWTNLTNIKIIDCKLAWICSWNQPVQSNECNLLLLKKTMRAFDGVLTHHWPIRSQTIVPCRDNKWIKRSELVVATQYVC